MASVSVSCLVVKPSFTILTKLRMDPMVMVSKGLTGLGCKQKNTQNDKCLSLEYVWHVHFCVVVLKSFHLSTRARKTTHVYESKATSHFFHVSRFL